MTDLDTRAREAARAAHAAVEPIAAAMLARRREPRKSSAAVALTCLGAGVATLVLAIALLLPDTATTVSVGPAASPTTTISPRPPFPPDLPDSPIEVTPLAEGKSDDGRSWWLYIGGPSADLCLSAETAIPEAALPGAPPTTVLRPGTCGAGATFGPADTFRPHENGDIRVPDLVFGRMPEGVVSVAIELGGSVAATDPAPVVQAEGGPYYVIEIPADAEPLAAVGQRADGTTIREPFR